MEVKITRTLTSIRFYPVLQLRLLFMCTTNVLFVKLDGIFCVFCIFLTDIHRKFALIGYNFRKTGTKQIEKAKCGLSTTQSSANCI